MPVIYVDFRTAPVDGRDCISEFTWLVEDEYGLTPNHYFVDYPGAKDLERQITEVIGGSPMVRYSAMTVLKAFVDSIGEGYVVAFRTAKQRSVFLANIGLFNITTTAATCVFADVVTLDEELASVVSSIEEARTDASRKFGNSL